MVLSKKTILVEGSSDELIVQKAFVDKNGKLPIEDSIDVISVGTSFLRFLEIAERIQKPIAVVTDNDGNVQALRKKYEHYLADTYTGAVKLCFDENEGKGTIENFNYNTLEPNIVKSNGWEKMNAVLDAKCQSEEELHKFMKNHKTECALRIFNTSEPINFPQYILDAITD